jgi:branched-subunit amino acid transport protein
MSWALIGALGLVCFALRVAGPLLLRGRELPRALEARLEHAVVPLVAALIATQLFVSGGRVTIDARSGGVAAAGAIYLRTRSLPLSLIVAAALTAALRA